ncbi:MAG: endonuclease/exonuclease/phosphatase family protein [Chloroflexota bacterium]
MRLLVYNINGGDADRIESIYSVLAHARADVIALTEANDERVIKDIAARLEFHFSWERGSGDRHVATLSRYPIIESHIHRAPPLTQAALETVLRLPNERIRIFNVHLLPYLLLPFEIRRWQAVGKLLEIIRSRQVMPTLIVGDLNAIAPKDRVLQHLNPPRMRRVMALQFNLVFHFAVSRLLKAGYTDCYRKLHDDDGFTWMTGNRTTRYDYVMADNMMTSRLRSCCVIDDVAAINTASDHLPLMAEFDM